MVKEIAVGLDELGGVAPTIERYVIALRKQIEECCVLDYCPSFSYIDFGIRVHANVSDHTEKVQLSRRASSIGLDLIFDGVSDGVARRLGPLMREATSKIAAHMGRTDFDFDTEGFTRDMSKAIDNYETEIAAL